MEVPTVSLGINSWYTITCQPRFLVPILPSLPPGDTYHPQGTVLQRDGLPVGSRSVQGQGISLRSIGECCVAARNLLPLLPSTIGSILPFPSLVYTLPSIEYLPWEMEVHTKDSKVEQVQEVIVGIPVCIIQIPRPLVPVYPLYSYTWSLLPTILYILPTSTNTYTLLYTTSSLQMGQVGTLQYRGVVQGIRGLEYSIHGRYIQEVSIYTHYTPLHSYTTAPY